MTVFKIEFEWNNQKYAATVWKFVTIPDGIVQFHVHDIQPLPEGVREILVYIANEESTGFDFPSTPESFDFMAYVLVVIQEYCGKNSISLFKRDFLDND